ncbi:glycosyltransferase [bacterium]|nr:glycosyltransferase [bacterium]
MNKISIIIPVYNAEKTIEPLLKALENQTVSKKQLQIILVDNRSTDNTLKIIDKYLDKLPITVTPEYETQNSYAARNKGLKRAEGEVICFLDSDCIPDKDWLREGIKYFQTYPDRYLVAGVIKCAFEDMNNIIEIYDSTVHLDQEYYVQIGGSGAGNLFARKEVIDKIKGFEERIISGGDFEFCRRAQQNGFKLYYNRKTIVHHPTMRTLNELLRKSIRFGIGDTQLWRIKKTKKLYFLNPLNYIPGPAFFQKVYKHKRQNLIIPLMFLFCVEAFARAVSNFVEFMKLAIFNENINA